MDSCRWRRDIRSADRVWFHGGIAVGLTVGIGGGIAVRIGGGISAHDEDVACWDRPRMIADVCVKN